MDLDGSMGRKARCFWCEYKCWKGIHTLRIISGRLVLIVFIFSIKQKAAASIENKYGREDVAI